MEHKDLFERFMRLKNDMQLLAGIVQNEGYTPTSEQLAEWERLARASSEQLGTLIQAVAKLYGSAEL